MQEGEQGLEGVCGRHRAQYASYMRFELQQFTELKQCVKRTAAI